MPAAGSTRSVAIRFGGLGESWKGTFVGGRLLVEAVTQGSPGQPVLGNYPNAVLLPEQAWGADTRRKPRLPIGARGFFVAGRQPPVKT